MEAKTYFYGNGCPSLISHGKKTTPTTDPIRFALDWLGITRPVSFN